jgi:energy-coupling factor transporter transmembrane protein EcfT
MTNSTLDTITDAYRRPATRGNPILDLNPITMLLSLTFVTVAAVAVPGWIAPVMVSVLFVAVAYAAGRGTVYLVTFLKLWLVVGLLLFVLRALLIEGEQVLIPLGPIAVTVEGIQEGLQFATVVMAICGAVTLFFTLVPMRHLTLALERLGVSPRASFVLLASFQSITDLGATARVVLDAQKARGIETEGNILVRAKAFFPILAPVFLTAMSATEERAIALDARAFNSPGAKTSLVQLRPTPAWEWVIVAVTLIVALAAIVGGAAGWL